MYSLVNYTKSKEQGNRVQRYRLGAVFKLCHSKGKI